MKALIIILIFTYSATLVAQTKNEKMKDQTIYQFEVKDIDGNIFDFSQLKGKKIMIVNTASKCGFTPQYADLQELYIKYKDGNFIIIGFPANNFFKQEPGSNKEIAAFCQKNYGVDFPMMSKISVKGKEMHPVYQFLTDKEKNGAFSSKVKWNFQKYLIDKNGRLVKMYKPRIKPNIKEIIDWIEE